MDFTSVHITGRILDTYSSVFVSGEEPAIFPSIAIGPNEIDRKKIGS